MTWLWWVELLILGCGGLIWWVLKNPVEDAPMRLGRKL